VFEDGGFKHRIASIDISNFSNIFAAIAEAKSLNLALPDAIVDVILGNIGHNSSDKNFLLIISASYAYMNKVNAEPASEFYPAPQSISSQVGSTLFVIRCK
jgi:hypothetical protein